MSELAVHYVRKTPGRELTVAVLKGSVTRVHVPDDEARAHFVTAMLKARGEADEELELFGEVTSTLAGRGRERLRARIGAVSPIVGLMANLNAWENISLPAAYHGRPPLERVAGWANENGFDALEIACWPAADGEARRYAGVTHIDVDALESSAAAAYKSAK